MDHLIRAAAFVKTTNDGTRIINCIAIIRRIFPEREDVRALFMRDNALVLQLIAILVDMTKR
jgi:hypothetical protein